MERIYRFLATYRKHVPVPMLLTAGLLLWFIIFEHVIGVHFHVAVPITVFGGLLVLSQVSSIVLSQRKCPKCGKKFNETDHAFFDVSNDTCVHCGYKADEKC